jgi:hypothetical protein
MAGIPDIRAKIAFSVARVINVNVDLAGRGDSAARPIGKFISTCAALLPSVLGFVICRSAGASALVTVCGCLGITGAAATMRSALRRRRAAIGTRRRDEPTRPPSRKEIAAADEPKRKRPGGRSGKRSNTRKRRVRREKNRRRPRR